MSQWNNSYAYNNQYHGGSNWNGDVNGQYVNQAYYPNRQYDQSNQYVSFDEFLSQMQSSSAPAANAGNYNQYQNYQPNQFEYQNVPSSSQNAQLDTYNYGTNATHSNSESSQAQNQYKPATTDPNTLNEMVIKSNLTPTATEFVPKGSVKSSSSTQNTKAEPSKPSSARVSRSTHGSSSDSNWRERPQSAHQNGSKSDLHRQESNHRTQDSFSRNSDSSHNHQELSSRSQQSNGRNRNYESSNRNYDSNSRYESNRNESSSSRSYESNHYNDRGQKSSSKLKNKDSDRTFYNSSMNKGYDGRNGKEGSGRSRNYAGSQRVRPMERNNDEDEQYASNYLQYKEEKLDRIVKEHISSPVKNRNKGNTQGAYTELTQRERLTDQLDKGTLECLVCCERVKQTDPVWSCSNCYHVLHLKCIRKWAMSSVLEGKWRCPACQNMSQEIPMEYRCMCGALRNPDYQRGSVGAHTCGKACKRPRSCPHPCTLSCHPGPCPPCQSSIAKECGCGAETRMVTCSDKTPQVCGRECKRTLLCRVHNCKQSCHDGPCEACAEFVTQVCYCTLHVTRTVPCTEESGGITSWTCEAVCQHLLGCGAHTCTAHCHPPPCPKCPLLPETTTTCPCGKTRLDKGARKACTDPIPLCGNICAKPLPCGPASDRHFCKLNCHEGKCPVCPEKTVVQCRCGHSSREVPCAKLPDLLNNVLCQKKCNKKLSCGRHKCRDVCCASSTHRCGVVCGRTLSCQLHRCEEFCHTGHCAPCPQLSFEELTCECGAEVILPPVRCGTKPPACNAPCQRTRPCGHPPHHSCHSGDCPPCVVLTTKMCHGQHEERKTIPCSQEEFSCGLPCGKPLPCGKHTCIKTCHKGPCDTGKCTQPCNEKRPSCGHPCAAACHLGTASSCPSTAPCRRLVRATCPCGRRSADRACADNARDLARIMSALAATNIQEGGSVDLSDVQRPGAMLKTLECDDECRIEARNRQLALALQIRNPDVSAKLAPRYSEHVRAIATKEPSFAQQVHDKLTELVQLAKKSKQKTRSHSFPSMNWQKRQFIHELCEQFGCESVAYDAEPNRNVVATADREKSWLPAMSVLEVLGREAGKRRVPPPVLRALPAQAQTSAKSSGGWATLTSTNAWAARSNKPTSTATPAPAQPEKIDYFDNPPDN